MLSIFRMTDMLSLLQECLDCKVTPRRSRQFMWWYCFWGDQGEASPKLLQQVKDLWLWCTRNIFLQAQHLPSAANTIATVRQGCGQTDQKELSLRFFQFINAQLSPLLVDLARWFLSNIMHCGLHAIQHQVVTNKDDDPWDFQTEHFNFYQVKLQVS